MLLQDDTTQAGFFTNARHRLTQSRLLLFVVLVIAFVWPWFNLYLWSDIAPLMGEWLGSDDGWRNTRDWCFHIGFLLGLAPILASNASVLDLRAQAIISPLVLYAVVWVHWAAWAGVLFIRLILVLVW